MALVLWDCVLFAPRLRSQLRYGRTGGKCRAASAPYDAGYRRDPNEDGISK